MCSFAHADPLEYFVQSMNEQDKAVEWIDLSTKGKLGPAMTREIVSTTYAQAISYNVDPRLVIAVMRQESNFQANAKSFAGAKGLMQVIPKYHKDKLKGRDPFKPKVSIEVGTAILQEYIKNAKGSLPKALRNYSGGARQYHTKVINFKMDFAQSLKPKGEILAAN